MYNYKEIFGVNLEFRRAKPERNRPLSKNSSRHKIPIYVYESILTKIIAKKHCKNDLLKN